MRKFGTICLLLTSMTLPAMASLGGNRVSVADDQARLGATMRFSRLQAYDVHEMKAPTGTYIREYVSPAGTVFAVAWQGPALPNMKQVLGSYFTEFQAAASTHHGHGGPLVIHEQDLVVESGGHMRSFAGRAYVPQLIPEGVNLQDVK